MQNLPIVACISIVSSAELYIPSCHFPSTISLKKKRLAFVFNPIVYHTNTIHKITCVFIDQYDNRSAWSI